METLTTDWVRYYQVQVIALKLSNFIAHKTLLILCCN